LLVNTWAPDRVGPDPAAVTVRLTVAQLAVTRLVEQYWNEVVVSVAGAVAK
jgi:hypothetical protein